MNFTTIRTFATLLVAASVTTATLVALPANGAQRPPGGPIGEGFGTFQVVCAFSHGLADDPIVFPRAPGASHPHAFFGARTTDAASTVESIRASPTSCTRNTSTPDDDRSAYWVPELSVGGRVVRPTQLGTYYNAGIRRVREIEPLPEGLKIIAGASSGGPREIDGHGVWAYLCPGGTQFQSKGDRAPICKTERMDLVIRFPDCWDGVNLDSPDHRSHMAYSRREHGSKVWTCSPSHPRLVPQLEMQLRYPTRGGWTVRLASGAINSAHADFFNAWNPEKQASLVRKCINADKYCGGTDNPDH